MLKLAITLKIAQFFRYEQCCGSGFGSAWIRNFLSDPELEISDPDPGQSPKLDGKMHKNHKK
jgi:hypothetical protein